MDGVKVGIIGSGFVSDIHADSIRRHVVGAEVAAAASPTPGHAEAFAARHGIPKTFADYRALLEMPELDMVLIAAPNDLHCQMACDAAGAGKHVVVEKPLCLNLAEADRMIETCRGNGVLLMYAEELCFAPKYVRLKQLLDEGALGELTMIKQSEKHDGPHAPHFWDVKRSGGGVTMDMGCHAIEFFRWIAGRDIPIASVFADMNRYVHGGKTLGDDHTTLIVKFANGVTAMAEESWIKKGGMDDQAELLGTGGVAYANLLRGNAILAYSEQGYGYAVEKAGLTRGWTFPIYEEAWNYGFPQEMQHFADCVRLGQTPSVTGEDGRKVLEAVFAAYASAAQGRVVPLPYRSDDPRPVDVWLESRGESVS